MKIYFTKKDSEGVMFIMNKKHLFYILFISLFIFVGCSNSQTKDTSNSTNNNREENEEKKEENIFPVTINIDGKEITIQEKPNNILPLSLEMAEIVLELVDPSHITATTKGIDDPYLSTHADVGEAIENRISAASNIDPEEIIAYDTDVLLLTKMFRQQEEADKILSQLNTPIVSFDAIVTVDQFMEVMEIIGEIVGEKDKATSIVHDMRTSIENIQENIPEEENPSILILSEIGGNVGPFILGPTNISYDLIKLAGATPAVDGIGLERSAPASIEQILKMNPDYIILLDFFGKGEEGFKELTNDQGWKTLTAAQEDRIKVIDAKYILNPNVENVEGLQMITNWIYDSEH